MSIPDHLIEEVRSRADLLEIVGEHTRLKRSGRTFRGPCPLHGGQGPNFSVDPAKGFYKCFTCGEGGDVFSFPMKHLGMDFLESVRFIAERVGVEIPDPREQRPEVDPNSHFHEANAFAAEWFQRQLREPGGEAARNYLQRRGIGDEAVERFGLGWAPEAWSAFREAAATHRIAEETLLELGLLKRSKQGRDPYDAFRGRIIFPIEDAGRRVIAFGGRVLNGADDEVPKYLNSPESPVYHKGATLYGLSWSRGAIRKDEMALVVEGYMDYVSLAAQGVENVVAPLGTAMTEEQAELLARYAPRVTLLYDSDKAGLKATFRSGDELLRAGVEVLVATLPEGEDPDSLVRAGGGRALRPFVDDAVDVLERKIQILERKGFFTHISGTRRAIDALLPTVRAATDEVLRGVYLQRISDHTGVPTATLEREVASVPPRDKRHAGAPERRQRGEGQRAEKFGGAPAPVAPSLGPERNLLLLLLRDESWVERAAQRMSIAEFRYPPYRTIYEGILLSEGNRDAEGAWLNTFPEAVLPLLEELRGDPEAAEIVAPEEFFTSSVRSLLARPFEERIAEIEREMPLASSEQQQALLQEKEQISRTMREQGLLRKSGLLARSSAGADRRGR